MKSPGGGAWPFLVRGVICQVNSVNGRDRKFYVSPVWQNAPGRAIQPGAPRGCPRVAVVGAVRAYRFLRD